MNTVFKPQVSESGFYKKDIYDTLERFISYYHQISWAKKLEAQDILEIGIGNGLVASYLKSLGRQVTTCDFDQTTKPDIVADVRHIPLPDQTFDLIMACQVLEHVPFEDFKNILLEFHRLTKKYVLISLPVRSSYFEVVLRVPLVRSFFKKTFLDFYFRKLLRFPGFASSGQHHWEIDKKQYTFRMIKDIVKEHYSIVEDFSPVLNKYHYFLILEKK